MKRRQPFVVLGLLLLLVSCQRAGHREAGEAGRPASPPTVVVRDAAVDAAPTASPGAGVPVASRGSVSSAPWRALLLAAKDAFLRGDDLATVAGLFGRATRDGARLVVQPLPWMSIAQFDDDRGTLEVSIWLKQGVRGTDVTEAFGRFTEEYSMHPYDDGVTLEFEPTGNARGTVTISATMDEPMTVPSDGTISAMSVKWVPASPPAPTP
jgi:hypothetical protein